MYAFTDNGEFITLTTDGTRSIDIKKKYIKTRVSGNFLLISWHDKERRANTYQKSIDWNDVTSPVVASAAALQTQIDGWINNSTPAAHASSHTNGTDDIQTANGSQKGLLSSSDWTTFNSKVTSKLLTLSVQPTIVTHTGTAAETILYSYKIPAGTIGNNDMLRVNAMFRKNSGTGQLQGRVRLHTSNAIGGTIIGFSTLSSANSTMRFMCDQVWQNTNNATIGWPVGSGSFATNWGTSYVTTALDNTADIWVIVTAQLVTSTDTSELSFARVELFKYP